MSAESAVGADGRLRVLLAVALPLLRAGLREALGRDARYVVAGEASAGAELLALAGELSPDVVLLDESLPGADPLALVEALRRLDAPPDAVLLVAEPNPAAVRRAFAYGAAGVLVKSIDPRHVALALAHIVQRTVFTTVQAGTGTGHPAVDVDLTAREVEILRAVSTGRSNRAVAEELGISEATVKAHLSSIFRKLGVDNRTQAARWALACGLHDPLAGSRVA